ncbi:FUSC family protein [Streptomyces californicus]
MSWVRALKDTARSGLEIERQRLEPLIAFRGAAGLALVIGTSLVLFGPEIAASSAFGAFQAAIATFQRSWRPRPVLALVSGVSLAVSTFVGYVSGAHVVLFLCLLGVWTFLAGLAWAAGPTGGIIAASNVAIMLVTITLPTSVADAAAHAGMIAIGGVVQAALIVLFPVRRWGAQRDALADALAAEADYARRLRHDPVAPFDPLPLMTARSAAAVTPRQARRRPAELHGARGVAERLRPVLASLADPAMGVPGDGLERLWVNELLGAAGSVLDAAARAVRTGEPVHLSATDLGVLKTPDNDVILVGPARRAADRLAALLDDVLEIAEGTGTDSGIPTDLAPDTRQRPTLLKLVPVVLASMRRELHHGSPVLRHAIRVAVVAVSGYFVGEAVPLGHGYWAPMTAVMVMRPEFSQTYSRAAGRFGGTLIGVGLATAIVQTAHPGARLSALLAVVCAGLMYLLMRTGYAVGQVCVSAYVVFLLGMAGDDWSQTVTERIVLTLAGGLLAMVSYAVYPAWETPRLRNRLAEWLVADGRYAAAVVEVRGPRGPGRGGRPGRADRHPGGPGGVAGGVGDRPARTGAPRGISRAAATDAQHALAQLGRSAMVLEAHLPARSADPVPGAARLAEALRDSTEKAARAVRERRLPDWQPVVDAVAHWDVPTPTEDGTSPVGDPVVRRGAALLLEALEEFTRALDERGGSTRVSSTLAES